MGGKNTFTEVPVLETNRLLLRAFNQNDIDDIFEYASDPEVSKYLPWDVHVSKKNTIDFLKASEENFQRLDIIDWGIELKNEHKLIGGISIRNWNNKHLCADAGYVISKKYWNRGIATEALAKVIQFGFETLCVNRIEAHCDDENIGSSRVMEKCGMKYEGTLRQKVFEKGRFVDAKFYSILRNEFNNHLTNHKLELNDQETNDK